jgi:cytochrome b561
MATQESSFAAATRIAAGDDGTTYDGVAIALHWATAALVAAQFALAETWDWFARPTHRLMVTTHMSFGVLLTAVIVARLAWRLIRGHQVPPIEIGWMRLASRLTHYLLYALLVVEAGLGFTFRWGEGRPMSFFGLGIPGPFGPFAKPTTGQLLEIHNYVAWAIVTLAALHAAAALYHHYVLKDRVLVRMLPSGARPA